MKQTSEFDRRDVIDFGDDHYGVYLQWAPDRDLNPHRANLPDVDRYAMVIMHYAPNGNECTGQITFAGDVQREISPNAITWDVQSWDPLTISPSILCGCGDHGYIREGRWVRA